MQIFENNFNDIKAGYPIEKLAPLNKILFIDIETTGLSRELTNLYLIGCGYFDADGYNTIQWFADDISDEPSIIQSFNDYVSGRFDLLIHYNGNHFDIPYLKRKAEINSLDVPFDDLENYDIYAKIKPYKKLLSLPSLRQRCVEELLEINSDDPYTGKELIGVYHSYLKDPRNDLLEPLLYHNLEDLKGMAYILPILYYTELGDLRFHYVSHEIHEYKDYLGNSCREVLVNYSHDLYLPKSFNTLLGKMMLHVGSDKTALLRLPLIEATLKRFYNNCKDYYYLPAEDTCIYRSVASAVPKDRRENAKKETCYTKHSGLFIPVLSGSDLPILKSDYSSSEEFTPFVENDCQKLLTDIGLSLTDRILSLK